MVTRVKSRVVLAAVAAVSASGCFFNTGSAGAQTLYWDINGTTDGAVNDGITPGPVAGTWDTTTANWNTDPTGGAAGAVGTWQNGSVAAFSAGTNGTTPTSTITVIGAQQVSGLDFQEGELVLSGIAGSARLTLTAPSTLNVASGAQAQIFPLIEGAFRVTKDGPGKLIDTPNSPNTFSGFTLNAGAYQMAGDSAFGAAPGSVAAGAGNVLLNGGSLVHGNGITSLTVNANRGIVVGAAGVTFDANSTGSWIYNGANLSGTGTITKKGPNILVLGAANANFSGKFVVNAGSLQSQNGTDLPFGPVPGAFVPDAITLENGGGLRVGPINYTIQANRGITLGTGGGLLIPFTAGSIQTIDSVISGVGSLTKTLANVSILNGLNTYTGGTIVQDGTLRVKRLQANSPVQITGGRLEVMPSSPTLPSHPAGDNTFVSRPSALSITGTGKLDLANNDLILDYTGASPAPAIEALVRSGFNGGDWLGNGITSSVAALDGNYHLAIADNALLASPFGTANGGPLFAGVDVPLNSVLIKFTHRVDLDLDGLITPNDSAIFGTNYSEGDPAYWAIGDIDMDGFFTPNDAAIFGTFYDDSVASLPEPSTLGVLAVLGLCLSRRRRTPAH